MSRTQGLATVVSIIQAHRRVADKTAERMAEVILAALADRSTWDDEAYLRADAFRRAAMH